MGETKAVSGFLGQKNGATCEPYGQSLRHWEWLGLLGPFCGDAVEFFDYHFDAFDVGAW